MDDIDFKDCFYMAKQNKPSVPKVLKKSVQGPETKEALKGLRITVNEFGEIVRDYNIDDINKFLDETVPDKKLTLESEQ